MHEEDEGRRRRSEGHGTRTVNLIRVLEYLDLVRNIN